jgi:hypothetical protein
VPNGLLEALGSNRFHPQGLEEAVVCGDKRPLVMITTNEERSLPDAFVRRCLSLHLSFPNGTEQQLDFLVKRAQQNARYFSVLNPDIFLEAAKLLIEDRQLAKGKNLYPLPGQAEYFDLLRGIQNLCKQTGKQPSVYIEQLRKFTYQKHPGFHTERS